MLEARTRHLVASEPFFYDGRTLEVGERFSATPQHAMILEGLSKAKADDDDAPAAQPVAAAYEDDTPTPEIDNDPDTSGTDAERAERNRRRRERKNRVLHTSTREG